MRIGFVGLGNMGRPMAETLAAAGHEVVGFDTAAVEAAGVSMAPSAAEAVRGVEVAITMLPDGAILRAVTEALIPEMARGTVLLDCSTVDVDSARAVAERAEAAGLLPLDAPVSGGTAGAAAGTLTFMVGGSVEAFERVSPLLDVMGSRSVHCGPSGAGQAAKICNNMMLGVTMIATCEAFALASRLGLDRRALYDVASTSSGQSWSLTTYCPAPGVGPESPADRGYRPGFAAELMLKDLRLSQQAAGETGAETPMGAAAADLYRAFVEEEDGRGRDFSAMLARFERGGGRDPADVRAPSDVTSAEPEPLSAVQTLSLAGHLFPRVLSGEKTSTIRWQEAPVTVGPLALVHDDEPSRIAVVNVRRCSEMPLSMAASFLGKAEEWPDDVMLAGMRDHYPAIELSDLVQVVEFDPPA